MSQKSSVPQAVSFVSQVLKRDKLYLLSSLQSGAKIVAENQNIQEVQLSADSTTTDYVVRFLERAFHGYLLNLQRSRS